MIKKEDVAMILHELLGGFDIPEDKRSDEHVVILGLEIMMLQSFIGNAAPSPGEGRDAYMKFRADFAKSVEDGHMILKTEENAYDDNSKE